MLTRTAKRWLTTMFSAASPRGSGRWELEGSESRVSGKGSELEVPGPAVREPIGIIENMKKKVMSFGLNRAEVIGRLGAGVTVNASV